MKKISRFSALQDKKLTNKEEFRGGSAPPIDRPSRPTGGLRPPFGRGR